MKEIEALRKAAEPFQKISEALKPFQEMSKNIAKFQLLLPRPLALIDAQMKAFQTPDFQKQVQGFLDEQKRFHQITSDLAARLSEVVKKTPDSVLLLAHHNWYLDYDADFAEPVRLAELIEDGKISEVDDYLILGYSERFDCLMKDLAERHEDRRAIFSEISLAYKAGFYFSVVILTLAQIDGICNDCTQKKFFLKREDKKTGHYLPEVSQRAAELAIETFLPPFVKPIPINAHESILSNFPNQLNRHTIMHGTDKEYGTKMNALKCISLLKYISDVLVL